MADATANRSETVNWWERRDYALALVLLCALPLVWPTVPPLADLPAHMGRYRVQLDLGRDPALQQFFAFEWRLIANLGVDLLIIPLEPLLGLENAVKLVALALPPLTAAGWLAMAREVHGRMPPTAPLALPFAYGFPFHFGFTNFVFSMALAMLAFALWLRLARARRLAWRAAIFAPLSVVIWVAHAYGWAVLCVLAFAAEIVRQRTAGTGWTKAVPRACIGCLPLAPPLLLMLIWRSGSVQTDTGDWFNWEIKLAHFLMVLRDRWAALDQASLWIALLALAVAARHPKIRFSPVLALAAAMLAALYLMLPRVLLGSAYADMRLAPYMLAIALLAIGFAGAPRRRALHLIAIGSLLFFVVRIGANTVSFWLYDQRHDRELAAVDHIARGSRVVAFVGRECQEDWRVQRLDHLPSMALVRRNAFVNDQYDMAGAQLLKIIHRAPGFSSDPSHYVVERPCADNYWRTVDAALRDFPRDSFDYVWLLDPPLHDPRNSAGLTELWRDGASVLYRIDGLPPAD